MLEEYQSILSVKLLLEAYSIDANATLRAWVLLEPDMGVPLCGSRASRSGRASVSNTRNIPRDPSPPTYRRIEAHPAMCRRREFHML